MRHGCHTSCEMEFMCSSMVTSQGFEQRVMHGIEKHKGGGDPGGLGGIEISGRDRGIESDGQLSFRLVLNTGSHPHQRHYRAHNQPHPRVSQHTSTSSGRLFIQPGRLTAELIATSPYLALP